MRDSLLPRLLSTKKIKVKNMKKQTNVWIEDDLDALLESVARKQGRSKSSLVQDAIFAWMREVVREGKKNGWT